MSDAPRDDNFIPAWLGLSSLDGETPVPIKIDSSNGRVKVNQLASIAFTPRTTAGRDANDVATKLGTQGVNVLPIYVLPSTGAILIQN